MGRLLDLGTRIELVSMDPHFHDISLSLYRRAGAGGAEPAAGPGTIARGAATRPLVAGLTLFDHADALARPGCRPPATATAAATNAWSR